MKTKLGITLENPLSSHFHKEFLYWIGTNIYLLSSMDLFSNLFVTVPLCYTPYMAYQRDCISIIIWICLRSALCLMPKRQQFSHFALYGQFEVIIYSCYFTFFAVTVFFVQFGR